MAITITDEEQKCEDVGNAFFGLIAFVVFFVLMKVVE